MKVGESTLTALEFMDLDRDRADSQKGLGMASVVTMQCHSMYLAKLTNYLEGERYPQLQKHELIKEQYLRQLRDKNK